MMLLVTAAVAFAVLALTWIAYPAFMWIRARGHASALVGADPTERVSVVVATRDDPALALARVRNLREAEYLASKLQVVIAVDRAATHPLDAYRSAIGGLAVVVAGDAPGGKAANLNAGVRAAGDADILVFADVGQEFGPKAIRMMVSALQDRRFGGVTGRYTQQRENTVMSAYARLEAVIRAGQARGHSVVSTSGSIYAIRAGLWRELPPGLICDDLFTTTSVVRQGYRVGFCPEAVAFDPREFTRDQEFARRVRTLTGLIQYCTLEAAVLLPWANPNWSHFVLHKLLRLLTPIPLVIGTAAVLGWTALNAPRFLLTATLIVAAAGLVMRVIVPRAFQTIANRIVWLLRLQLVPSLAIANGLRRRWTIWTPTPQGDGSHAGAGAGL